jgi:hypothetical protein
MASSVALRVVLALAGAFIAFTGVNIAFGGIPTLGWQGESVFLQVTNERAFLIQDSHVRFLGGLWLGVSALFFLASLNIAKYRTALSAALALIFLGGLARLTQMEFQVLFSPDLVGSLLAELVGVPALYVWVLRATRTGSRRHEELVTAKPLYGTKENEA